MSSIVDFLTARIDEDEQVARAADHYSGEWVAIPTDGEVYSIRIPLDHPSRCTEHEPGRPNACDDDSIASTYGFINEEDEEHRAIYIARFDPARVLRECATKRALIENYSKCLAMRESGHETAYAAGELAAYETVVYALAAVYNDHPQYRKEWAL